MATVMAGVEEASAKLTKLGSIKFRDDSALVKREPPAATTSPVGQPIDAPAVSALAEQLRAQREHLERLLASYNRAEESQRLDRSGLGPCRGAAHRPRPSTRLESPNGSGG